MVELKQCGSMKTKKRGNDKCDKGQVTYSESRSRENPNAKSCGSRKKSLGNKQKRERKSENSILTGSRMLYSLESGVNSVTQNWLKG